MCDGLDLGGCDCGSCDCGSCDCDCGDCDCGDCNCGDCDCGDCDCGDCDCGDCNCDCGHSNSNCCNCKTNCCSCFNDFCSFCCMSWATDTSTNAAIDIDRVADKRRREHQKTTANQYTVANGEPAMSLHNNPQPTVTDQPVITQPGLEGLDVVNTQPRGAPPPYSSCVENGSTPV